MREDRTVIRKIPLQLTQIPVHVAPFWRRTLALFIDGIPLLTLWLLLMLVTGLADTRELPESRWNTFDMLVDLINQQPFFFLPPALLLIALVLVYYTVTELILGVSVGKRLLNLTMVDAHGRRPLPLMIVIRNLMRMVSLLLLGWGYLWAAFDTERRTLHDWVSGIWVVKRDKHLPVPR